MATITEPSITVTEKIRSYSTTTTSDGTSNIGGVVVAPTGPRIAYIQGPQSFLDTYTVDGELPRNADISLINAYYLSYAGNLVLARALNTTATNGLAFTETQRYQSKIQLDITNSTIWGMVIDGILYYYYASSEDFSDFASAIGSLMNSDGEYKYKDSDGNLTLTVTDETNAVNVTSESDLATKIAANLSTSKNKITAVYSSEDEAIYMESASEITKLSSTDEYETFECSISTKCELSTSFEATSINYKDGNALTRQDTLSVTITNQKAWAFTYGTMAYYHGAIEKSKYEDYSLKSVDSLDDIATSISGINGMSAVVEGDTIKVQFSEGNDIDLGELSDGCTVTEIDSTALDSASVVNSDDLLFIIYSENPQSSDKYNITLKHKNSSSFTLSLYDGSETNDYEVSLDPDATDSDGNNVYIENLNTSLDGFIIKTNPDLSSDKYIVPAGVSTHQFGASGLDLSSSKNVNCKINALYALEDREIYDIEYLAPLGETNLSFVKAFTTVGKANDWFTPVDIPYTKTNANSIKSYFTNVSNDSNILAVGPFDKNTGFMSWMTYIAASTLYYTKVLANKAINSEWAPVFDQTNGILNYTNPCYTLGKEDRTKLLNFKCPINFAVYNQRSNVYYFNDNRTHQSINNIVSEEQNRRCVNKLKKDCKRLLQGFKGRLNTTSTRAAVNSTLKYYFQNNVMNQVYCPNDYNIICDDTNNTSDIITANQLAVTVQVRLENSIKYINILMDVFPLGVDFGE